ncbi:hypothetical protein GCM10023205_59800 [Yinghuangia aomiensis]|uniref:IPT/TIG domain-containing protein n=1 Tax=Yinghuangia aomiensis TaxID=676205 RepID=A0ABP9HZU7_9ACTN
MQTQRTTRTRAAVLAGLIGITGAVVAVAPGAQATEVSYTSACRNDFIGPVGESSTKADVTVSPVKDTYAVGETVRIDWKWQAYNTVPVNSPAGVPENSTQPFGDIALSGAQTGVVQIQGTPVNPPANPGEPLKVTDMTGTFVLTAPGTLTLAPKGYKTVTNLGGISSTTTCDPAAGQVPGVVATLAVEGQQTSDPVLSGPPESHRGWEIELTGSGFAPNATPQLSLCAADGSNCDAGKFTANTLAVDAQGALSGKATLMTIPTVLPDGAYLVKVSDGAKSASYPISITPYVPAGQPAATATPSAGKVGDMVTIKGVNFPPLTGVIVYESNANGDILGGMDNAVADEMGNITAAMTISNPATTVIRLSDFGALNVDAPFTVLTVPPLSQSASVTLAPGALAMTQAGDGLDFGTVTLNGEAQTVKANLNQVTVTDSRGGTLGWSLTGSMTDLVAANGTDKIPAGNLAWTPSCAAGAGSLSTVTNGAAGPLSSAASTLCSVTAEGETSGGKFTGDAEVSLTTPKFGAAGGYTGTLTLTLI